MLIHGYMGEGRCGLSHLSTCCCATSADTKRRHRPPFGWLSSVSRDLVSSLCTASPMCFLSAPGRTRLTWRGQVSTNPRASLLVLP